MTKFKGFIKRSTYIITSLILVLSLVFPMLVSAAQLNSEKTSNDTGVIQEFKTSFLRGGDEVKIGGEEKKHYVWKANNPAEGHKFTFNIVYNFFGGETVKYLKPGDVEIKIPKHILRDRNGEFADDIYIGIPSQEEAGPNNQFAYEEYEDYLLITINEKYISGISDEDLSSTMEGNIEVSYATNKKTFEYIDMEKSDPFNAQITDNLSGKDITTDDIYVYIDTNAKLDSTKKENATMFYREWDSSWGDAPENANDYYYIIWHIRSYINNDITQPYNFSLEDTFNELDAEFVGYKMQGDTTYTDKNYVENLTATGYRYDYVLTKHLKDTYDKEMSYKLDNKITATLTPIDKKDDPTVLNSKANFNYVKPVFHRPIGRFEVRKYGNANWHEHFGTYWDVADYSLNDLKEGKKDCLDDNLKFYEYISGRPYPWTIVNGKYGQKKVKYELTDEKLYFEDEVDNKRNPRPLTYEDYEVKKIEYDWYIKDAEYNEDSKNSDGYDLIDPEYKDDDILYFYGKFNGSDEWKAIGTYSLFTGEANYDNSYVDLDNSDVGLISFYKGSNCTAWRITTENAYYQTEIEAYPYYRLKNSAYIMENIEGKNEVKLKNTNKGVVTNADGEEIFSDEWWDVDYIVGAEPHSSIKKQVNIVSNNIREKYASIIWQIDIHENYMTNNGVEAILQNSGTFYDLLPAGVILEDESTVNIMTERGFLSDDCYDIDTISNYKGTGRTLLKVNITEQAEYYSLVFRATYPWEHLKGYGVDLKNSVAYETGNDHIADGLPDDGGDIDDSKLMTDLDPSTEAEKFIYTQNTYGLSVETATSTGLLKAVKASTDKNYSRDTSVKLNSDYMYRLSYIKDANTKVKNMILFDSLENYVTDNGRESDWRGTLQSVDTKSQLENKLGIAPVVYYSTIEKLDMKTHHDLNEKINGEKVWLTEEELEAKGKSVSDAIAIAIDMSKDKNGDPFVLDDVNAVLVPIYMKAPKAETSSAQDPRAYNNVFISYTSIDELQKEKDAFLEYDYTTVHLKVAADIELYKADLSDPDKPVKGITFRLEGKSAYSGNIQPIDKKTGKNGKVKFEGIEKGTYTLFELEGTDDYQRLEETMKVVVNGDGTVTIDNKTLSEGSYFTVLDPRRAHTDIVFYKKDLKEKLPLKGFAFVLSTPASAYGNEITTTPVKSTADGKVEFKNIEKGTYTLREVRLSDDQYTEDELKTLNNYILSKEPYTVIVDDDGNFSITGNNCEYTKKGEYEIGNEQRHKFTIQKVSFTKGLPIKGAKFTLINRKNGKPVYMADQGKYSKDVETEDSGQLTFSYLESGSYTLQETHAPKDYILDDTPRLVKIDEFGNTTIEGLKFESGNFVVKNKEDGMVVITKRWRDKSDNESRPMPVINLSSKLPDMTATFANDLGNYVYGDNNGLRYSGLVSKFSHPKSFLKGTQAEYEAWKQSSGEEEGTRLDDRQTDCGIWAWYDSDNDSIKWWSNAKTVYFPEDSSSFFCDLDCESIDLSGIDTSKITNMRGMFAYCSSLKSLNLSNFDTSNVTDMSFMFYLCTNLINLDLSKFDTSQVTDMSHMFDVPATLSYPDYNLTKLNLSSFNTSAVTDMSSMFSNRRGLTELNLGSDFDTSLVTNMSGMFGGCIGLTELELGSKFDTSAVTNMSDMFFDCRGLTELNLGSKFDTSAVTDMSSMFNYCGSLTELNLGSKFDTSAVKDMRYMFSDCNSLTELNLGSNFDTSAVTDMISMFEGCSDLIELNLGSNFNTSAVTNMSSMFEGCSSLTELNLGSNFNTSQVTDMSDMFSDCSSLTELNLGSNFNTSAVTNMSYMFSNCSSLTELNLGSNFNTSAVTNMSGMFSDCSSLTELDLGSNFNTSAVKDMSYMFSNCSGLTELDLGSNFNTSAVTDMSSMFEGCSSLTELDLGSSFDTSAVTNMSGMFSDCSSLDSDDFRGIINNDNFDTSKVENMSNMFSSCTGVNELDFSNFVTSKVTDMSSMFEGCSSLTELDLGSSFDTSAVTKMSSMFEGCSSLTELDLSSFDTSAVTKMISMFEGCSSLRTIYVSNLWNTDSVTGSDNMFYDCISLTGGCSTKYSDRNPSDKTYAIIDGGKPAPGYLTNIKYATFEKPEMDDISFLTKITEAENILSFSKGDEATYTAKAEANEVFKMDDGKSKYHIWAWFDSSTGAVNWWSDAEVVYFPENSSYLFEDLSNIKSINLSGINTSGVTDMVKMFLNCESLTDLILGDKFFTSNVENMGYMFRNCRSLKTLDLSSFNTYKVTNMNVMFLNCNSLTTIYASEDWNVRNVFYSRQMFAYCTLLTGGVGEHPTYFDETKTNGEYARIHTESTPGYLTDIKDKPGYHETPAPTGAKAPAVLTSINAVPDVLAINALAPTALAPAALTLSAAAPTALAPAENDTNEVSTTTNNAIGDVTAELFELDNAERLNNLPVATTGDADDDDEDEEDNKDISITTDPSNYNEEYNKNTNTWTYRSKDDSSLVYTLEKFEDKWVYTFSGLTPGLDYYVWEDPLDKYTSSNTQEKPATVIDGKATITNTGPDGPHTFGDLFISKSVVASFPGDSESPTVEPTTGDLNRDFSFTITLTDEDNNPLEGTQSYDYLFFENGVATTSTSKSLLFDNGEVTISLSNGESVKIIDIPAGYHYTVTETLVDGFEAQQKNFSGTIEEDTISEAKFVNKKLLTETTSITLKKLVKGNFEDDNEIFRFYVSLNGLDAGKTYSLSNGDTYDAQSDKSAYVPISLQDGEEISFLDLPVGASYKITEAAGDYIASYEITDANSLNAINTNAGANHVKNQSLSTNTETIDKVDDVLEDVMVTFTNQKHKTANLKLKKLLVNAAENNTDSFDFQVELTNLEPLRNYNTDLGVITSDSDGYITLEKISLSANEEIIFYDLPVKSTYKITELANEYRASYELVDANNLGKIATATDSNETVRTDLSTAEETVNEGENVTVTFTNEKVKKDLTVTKIVDFSEGNKDQFDYKTKEFEFDIAFTGLDRNTEYTIEYTQKDVTGILKTESFTTKATGAYELSVKLKHDQSVTIKDLATNATYQITERASKNYVASYTASGSANAEIIKTERSNLKPNTSLKTEVETVDPNDMDVRFVYRNTYTKSTAVLPKTGLSDIKAFLIIAMFGTLLFAALYIIFDKKSRKLTK